jgi:hypothetical protein
MSKTNCANIDNSNTNDKEYKYILVDRTDPELMWNCAVSIIVFIILMFFLFMNWKPKCQNSTIFEDMLPSVDADSIQNSFGRMGGIREL